jgi:hypothetical protein
MRWAINLLWSLIGLSAIGAGAFITAGLSIPIPMVEVISSPGAPPSPILIAWDAAVSRSMLLYRIGLACVAVFCLACMSLGILDYKRRTHAGRGFPLD